MSEHPTPNPIFAPLLSGPGPPTGDSVGTEVAPGPLVEDSQVVDKDDVVTGIVLTTGSLPLEAPQAYVVTSMSTQK